MVQTFHTSIIRQNVAHTDVMKVSCLRVDCDSNGSSLNALCLGAVSVKISCNSDCVWSCCHFKVLDVSEAEFTANPLFIVVWQHMARLATLFGATPSTVDATVAVREISSDNDRFQLDSKLGAVVSVEGVSMRKAMTETIFSPETHDIPNVTTATMHAISSHMSVKGAVQMLGDKALPSDVSSLVREVVGSFNFAASFDEKSLGNARRAQNSLFEKALTEIVDTVERAIGIIQCKGICVYFILLFRGG